MCLSTCPTGREVSIEDLEPWEVSRNIQASEPVSHTSAAETGICNWVHLNSPKTINISVQYVWTDTLIFCDLFWAVSKFHWMAKNIKFGCIFIEERNPVTHAASSLWSLRSFGWHLTGSYVAIALECGTDQTCSKFDMVTTGAGEWEPTDHLPWDHLRWRAPDS